MTSPLSVSEKQMLSDYLGGSAFTQKQGADGLVPSLAIPFDPSETITVGDATVLLQQAQRSRRGAFADQLGEINSTLIQNGLTLADQDGVLKVNEVISPPISEDVEKAMYATPPNQPLNIRPGLPTAEATREAVESFFNRAEVAGESLPVVGGGVKRVTDDVRAIDQFFKRAGQRQDEALKKIMQPRETN